MIAWKKKLILLACGLATGLLVAPSNCEACGLFNWLKTRRAQRQAYRRSYYPTTACCGSTTAYYGGTCCPQTCQPACQQVVAQYVPQTCYRNAWTQVSVTNYRPVVTTDPCTGCQVTCMRPCTSYRWQLQRVPYTSYRPVYTVASPCQTCGTCGTCGTCSTGTCSSCTAGTAVVGGQCSSCGGGSVIIPNTTSQGAVVPSTTIQGGQQIIQGGSEPADLSPSLPSSQLQSSPVYRVPIEGTSATTPSVPGTTAQQETRTSDPEVTPIPDLAAPLQGENRAPRLLNEDDRRASLPVERGVVAHPISWSTSRTIQTTSAVVIEPASSAPSVQPAEEVWDDSGWEAVH